jgi:uncharacterized protein YjbI with pentapeptide repeats
MEERAKQDQNWWQKNKTPVFGFVAFVASALVIALLVVEVKLYGTGFAGKTLFDWLSLLGVLAIPIVAGFGVAWFTREQQLRDQQLAEQRAKAERDIAQDNQRETALQAYLDKMSELLLKEHLGERTADGKLNPEYEQVRKIAQVRTITVLNQLDAKRVSYVFAFLRDAGLMSTISNDSAVSLSDASFVSVNWSQAFLFQANLSGAFLQEANLSGANLRRANLTGAKLYGADLSGAILIGADLSGVSLIGANLKDARGVTVKELEKQAFSLKSATMPDGSKYETPFKRKEIISLLEEAGSPDKLDLSGHDLAGIDLSSLNLSGANFERANLWDTNLHRANLSGANLKGAHLGRANLKGANLNKAWVTREQLDRAESLEGATMPDGSIHP